MDRHEARLVAVRAAVEAGEAVGFRSTDPIVLHDTNNVVVWLAPHDVVAKVGIWDYSAEVLGREVDVSAFLAAAGAPVARPIGPLTRHAPGSWPVSLWTRLHPVSSVPPDDNELAEMLRRVHAALVGYPVELPSYLKAIEQARLALFDDDRMTALTPVDLDMLRTAFDELTRHAREHPLIGQPLHGEPHLGNVMVTAAGLILIDFEATEWGPVEWDLASLPVGVATVYGDVNVELLALLRLLNSARVATWSWAQADRSSMRAHGEHHLAIIRDATR